MNEQSVYVKTQLGQSEIDNRSGDLSLEHRRVLILTNGNRPVKDIGRLSSVKDYLQVLEQLLNLQYIALAGAAAANPSKSTPPMSKPETPKSEANAEDIEEARTIMLNSLQTFTSPIHSAKIMKSIQDAKTNADLKALMDAWGKLISDNPYTINQAEELRVTLMEKLF